MFSFMSRKKHNEKLEAIEVERELWYSSSCYYYFFQKFRVLEENYPSVVVDTEWPKDIYFSKLLSQN